MALINALVVAPGDLHRGEGPILIARHCAEHAITRAVADVDAPTSYYLTKTKHVITLARQP